LIDNSWFWLAFVNYNSLKDLAPRHLFSRTIDVASACTLRCYTSFSTEDGVLQAWLELSWFCSCTTTQGLYTKRFAR